jgi:hypothetical protein
MAYVLGVSAFQIGDPTAGLVLIGPGDFALRLTPAS